MSHGHMSHGHMSPNLVCFICMSRYSTLRQQREHFKPTEILLEIDHVDNDIAGYLAAQRIKLDC